MARRKTSDEWIAQFRDKYGNKFNYSNSVFGLNNQKIEIICNKHGSFFQTPIEHINSKHGCSNCANESMVQLKNKKFKEEFIPKAKEVHGDKFNYDFVNFVSMSDPVEVECSIHGLFQTIPTNHLQGTGCPKCAKNRTKNVQEYIEMYQERHGEYDYSLMLDWEKIDTSGDIKVICSEHGEFTMKHTSHLGGGKCPTCQKIKTSETSRFDSVKYYTEHIDEGTETGFLYIVEIYNDDETFIKIGISKHGAKKRLKKSLDKVGYKMNILTEIEATNLETAIMERTLHRKYKKAKYRPKIKFGGHTECFKFI